ncbi:hypothetical protein B6U93_03120 [Candidatus Woesearchaeota archaeon ex4484_78]|nr:MAG: hypothetical protein B6U93_03120 [Candidatus Woesearchaeota archaeon ex4484_78]
MEKIIAIVAHNDDQILSAGGTLAKFAKKGATIKTIVFSYGEMSNPYLKKEVIRKERIKEGKISDKIIGGKGLTYLGIKEGQFDKEIKEKKTEEKLEKIIKKEKPTIILTHSIRDIHPDHKAVSRLIHKMVKEKKIKCATYTFNVWSLVRLKKRNLPKMTVDISSTFNTKIKAALAHKSQKMSLGMLLWKIILNNWLNGILHGYKFGEVFYKIN